MLSTPVPSLQAIVVAHLSPDTVYEITKALEMPKLPTLKERINIRVLGTHNPIKIVTDSVLCKEIDRRREKQFGYIHPASSDFGNQSPRTKRLNKPDPERRIVLENNMRYTKVEFYDYYYYDNKLAKTKWNEAEERIDPEGSNYTYTKYQFYDYYKSKKLAEHKWDISTRVQYRSGYNYTVDNNNDYDDPRDLF